MAFYSRDLAREIGKIGKPSGTLYQRIMAVLTDDPMTYETIMETIGEPATKNTYVIAAIKKGITNGTITKIEKPKEKRLYAGHSYVKSVVIDVTLPIRTE